MFRPMTPDQKERLFQLEEKFVNNQNDERILQDYMKELNHHEKFKSVV